METKCTILRYVQKEGFQLNQSVDYRIKEKELCDYIPSVYSCEKCDSLFQSKERTENSQQSHDKELYKCGECKECFTLRSGFEKYLLMHSRKNLALC